MTRDEQRKLDILRTLAKASGPLYYDDIKSEVSVPMSIDRYWRLTSFMYEEGLIYPAIMGKAKPNPNGGGAPRKLWSITEYGRKVVGVD